MDDTWPDHLRQLLARHDEAGLWRQSARLDERLRAAPALLIFGAGQNGRMVAALMRKAGLEPAGYIDDTPAKIGQTVDGVPVGALRDTPAGALAVSSIFTPAHGYGPIACRLAQHGVEGVSLFTFLRAFGASRSSFYFLGEPGEVLAAADDLAWLAGRLEDEASFELLCAQVEFRLTLRHDLLPAWTAEREPPPAAWSDFAVIDAGAFDGDTLLPMLGAYGARISAAVALEPDPVTFAALERNLAACPTATAVRAAVDQSSGRRAFCSVGNQGSAFGEAGAPVDTVSIDDLAQAHLPDAARLYIKFDVEGAEAAALAGAARTIATRRPLMAVSAYHRPHDLWALPRQISAIDDAYRYRLRAHGADGADLVLYAVPPS